VIFGSARRAIMPSRALHGTFQWSIAAGHSWAHLGGGARACPLDGCVDTFPPRLASNEIAS